MIITNISSIYKFLTHLKVDNNINADLYIAAKQISQELLISTITVNDNEITFDQNEKKYSIYLDEHRLVRTPGFEIYAFNIDDINFFKKDDFIYMNVERDKNDYIFLIGASYEKLK